MYTDCVTHNYYRFLLTIVLAGILITLTTGSGLAGDRNDTAIRSITPMSKTVSLQEIDDPYEYFDMVGFLNQVNGKRVRIGDSELTLADGVSTSGLNLSNIVGAKLNAAGEVVLLMLISSEPN